jgi:hypothetical protein
MHLLFVDLFEGFYPFVRFGVGDVEAEGGCLGCLEGSGEDVDVEAVFDSVGQAGD